jgi:hypothetical protein
MILKDRHWLAHLHASYRVSLRAVAAGHGSHPVPHASLNGQLGMPLIFIDAGSPEVTLVVIEGSSDA